MAFRTAINKNEEMVYCVADPLKIVVDGKKQPIIAARYFTLPKTDFDRSLKALFGTVPTGGILVQDISLLQFRHMRRRNEKAIPAETIGYSFFFKKEVEFHRSPLLEYSCCLPIPSQIDIAGELPRHATVIGKRDGKKFTLDETIWKNLIDVSDFLDTSAQPDKGFVALLKGNPGSGKEVFANILHHGGLRRADTLFIQRSVGGRKTDDVQEQLVGRITGDGVHIGSDIVKAANGTLFLDEVEKIRDSNGYESPRELGNFLLRILEAKEFNPAGSSKPVEVPNVNWLFAGANLEASSATNHLPRDFKSRLNGEILISSPLDDATKARDYAIALFIYFSFYFVAKTVNYKELGAQKREEIHFHDLARWCLSKNGSGDWSPANHIDIVATSVGDVVDDINFSHSVSARSISRLAERFAQILVRIGEENGFGLVKRNIKDFKDFKDKEDIKALLVKLCPPIANSQSI